MKKNNLFTAICLATCLLSCSSNSDEYINSIPSYNRDVTNINMQTDEEIIEGDASHQFLASLLYTKLITTIGKPSKDIPMAVSYPDYFGGAFTDEGGNLTILIKGELKYGEEQVISIIGRSSILRFVECSYSYQELTDIMKKISNNFQSFPRKVQKEMCFYYIEDKENKVIIGLTNLQSETKGIIKKLTNDNKAIDYIECQKKVRVKNLTPKSLVIPVFLGCGSIVQCYRNNDSIYGSWAFRARDINDTTIIGMITAGHVMAVNSDSAFVGNHFVGLTPVAYDTPEIDAAFVETYTENIHNPINPTNILAVANINGLYPNYSNYTGELSTDMNAPCYDLIVNKRGWTTGLTTGKIKSTDFCEVVEDQNGLIVNIQHMILASFSCDEGDSGGVVYTYFSAQNKRYTTGILKGYVYYDTWGIYASVFTSVITALSMLHLERY